MTVKFAYDLDRFKIDRKNLGLTAEETAEKSGVSVNIIRNYDVKRKEPNPMEIKQICDAIGLDVNKYVKKIPPVKIAVLTNKGGAAKTSCAVNLAASMGKYFDKKTLIIDADLQQNTTIHLGAYRQLLPDDIVDDGEPFPEPIIDTEEFTISFPMDMSYYSAVSDDLEELDELVVDSFYNKEEIENKNFYNSF